MPVLNVQPTYGANIAAGYPGMPATMTGWDADTRLIETVAGIGFGLAVSQGTGERGIIIGGTAAGFIGVTYRDITLIPTAALTDAYPRYANAGVMVRGDIWVSPFEAVALGDPVYFAGATGRFGKTVSGNQLVAGGRWMMAGALDGLAILRIVRER